MIKSYKSIFCHKSMFLNLFFILTPLKSLSGQFFFFFPESPLSPNFLNTEYYVSSIMYLSIHITCRIFFSLSQNRTNFTTPWGQCGFHRAYMASNWLSYENTYLGHHHLKCKPPFPFSFPKSPFIFTHKFFCFPEKMKQNKMWVEINIVYR